MKYIFLIREDSNQPENYVFFMILRCVRSKSFYSTQQTLVILGAFGRSLSTPRRSCGRDEHVAKNSIAKSFHYLACCFSIAHS
jgi:hypothetical protein